MGRIRRSGVDRLRLQEYVTELKMHKKEQYPVEKFLSLAEYVESELSSTSYT